jgi:glycosyltransferase involved in cell wall biosynthesis
VRVSVIIASRNASATIERCLAALENQSCREPFEIILVDSSLDATPEIVRKQFPRVTIRHFDEQKYPGTARNIGIAEARGEVFAFIDTDCIADGAWLERIHEAHCSADLCIGGVVDNGNPESIVGWAAYFLEFSHWMPEGANGELKEIATCNLSIKREAFDRYGPFLEQTYCSDSAFHWKMLRDGWQAKMAPQIRISHINIDRWKSFLRHEFFHGNSYARVRVGQTNFSMARRLVYSFGIVLLPPVLYARIGLRVLRNRKYGWKFIQCTPVLLAGLVCWSAGEAAGYFSGPRRVA